MSSDTPEQNPSNTEGTSHPSVLNNNLRNDRRNPWAFIIAWRSHVAYMTVDDNPTDVQPPNVPANPAAPNNVGQPPYPANGGANAA